MGKTYETVDCKDLYLQANTLISERKSFSVIGLHKTMTEAITIIKNAVEKAGLRCRIYTANRSIATAASVIGGIALTPLCPPAGATLLIGGLAAAGTNAGHDIGTFNPDYEITKHFLAHQLTVTFKEKK